MKECKNILITGGAGFIGSAFIRKALESSVYNILNIDKLTYASNVDSVSEGVNSDQYNFRQADICDKVLMTSIFMEFKPVWVINFAAETHVDRSISNSNVFIETNIIGTYNLLEASRLYLETSDEILVDKFRFLHISTDEVFGDLKADGRPFTESDPYVPSSPYSASKASSDHLVRSWHRTYGVPVLITNCSNNYGPYQTNDKLIPLIISNALAEKCLPIFGDGLQIRDWLYVGDHINALFKILGSGQVGSSYNIGGSNELTNISLVHSICNLLDLKWPSKVLKSYAELIRYVDDRPGHDARYAVDNTKITKELMWSPNESIQSGLNKTVAWYLERHSSSVNI
jgi:dTDP-glucose 4,6-dehydratase